MVVFSLFRFIGGAGLILGMVSGCTPAPATEPAIPMAWQAVDTVNTTLPEGIRVYAGRNDALPLQAWYVHINEPDPTITTRVVVSDDTDGREAASTFAEDLGACVVVNGGYFNMRADPATHVGLLYHDHTLVAPATQTVVRDSVTYQIARAALGFAEDEASIFWATTRNDTVFAWHTPPLNRPGQPAIPLQYINAVPWQGMDALGAGPALIVNNRIWVTADEEVFFGTSIPNVHPRTAAGITSDGSLLVDGRQEQSRGVSLEELARMLHDLGAVQALNLDGGGSSSLVVNGTLLNRPTGGTFEREVMSALATSCTP